VYVRPWATESCCTIWPLKTVLTHLRRKTPPYARDGKSSALTAYGGTTPTTILGMPRATQDSRRTKHGSQNAAAALRQNRADANDYRLHVPVGPIQFAPSRFSTPTSSTGKPSPARRCIHGYGRTGDEAIRALACAMGDLLSRLSNCHALGANCDKRPSAGL
jgi:hypothetical protein